MSIPRFTLNHTALLVVDLQERLLPAMSNHHALTTRAELLINAANMLSVPVLATEHYPKGLGKTVPRIAQHLTDAVCVEEKLLFSAYTQPVQEHLARLNTRTVLVCGLEAHVCVLQTCLDLAEQGFVTAVVTDAIGSRSPNDRDTALSRMVQAGVVPTTVESALLDMVHEAGTERFKSILPLIK